MTTVFRTRAMQLQTRSFIESNEKYRLLYKYSAREGSFVSQICSDHLTQETHRCCLAHGKSGFATMAVPVSGFENFPGRVPDFILKFSGLRDPEPGPRLTLIANSQNLITYS